MSTAEVIAVCAGFVGLLTGLVAMTYVALSLIANMKEAEKRHRDERTTLVNRIQRPDLIPAEPEAIKRDRDEAERRRRMQAEIRSIGTVRHDPPPE